MKNKKRKKLKKPCNATFEPHCGMLSKERVRKGELAEYLTGKGGLCDHCGWLVEKHKLICHNHMPSNLIALGCYEKVDVITESDGWFKKTQTLIVKQKAL